ncbi:MAG: hypothetical protein HOE48_22870, partial [Candidatus Latescibacteria bacterium]|nr:hypothetical protein [Candidatus Latescibacterota bacterium]
HLFDGGFDRFGFGILRTGTTSTRLQNGWMQFYLGWAILIVGVVVLYIGWS